MEAQTKEKITISVISALILIAHMVWPSIKFDAAALFLIMICVIPWLGGIFKSIELPGGTKVEFREKLIKAMKQLESTGLLQESPTLISDPLYIEILAKDPNLALAGLRIEIERKLRYIAGFLDLGSQINLNLRQMVESMGKEGLFTPIQIDALHGILRSLNRVVHGDTVSLKDAEEIMPQGKRLLAALDKRIKKLENKIKAPA
jgi:hypothetical protein